MAFAEQLKAARLAAGMTQQQVAEAMGITNSTYCGYETGKRQPDVEKIKQIAKILNTSGDVLLETGRTPPGSNCSSVNSVTLEEQAHIEKYRALDRHGKELVDFVLEAEYKRCTESPAALAEVIYLPLPIQPASAGFGEFADDETTERVPVLRNVWTSKADYALRVHGDSMEPDMHDGDLLLVRAQPAVEFGEIGIFIHRNERYVKVFRGNRLESLNGKYEDIPFEEDTRCIGKVIGVLKPEWIAK